MSPTAPRCPRCRRDLDVVSKPGSTTFTCGGCSGRVVNLPALKRFAPPERVAAAWRSVWRGAAADGVDCPFCAQRMRTVTLDVNGPLVLDACRGCEAIWFDAGEFVRFSPARQAPPPKEYDVPEDARRAFARAISEEHAATGREEHRAGWVRAPRRGSLPWLGDALTRLLGL